MTLLDDAAAVEAWGNLEEEVASAPAEQHYRYYHPLADAATAFVEEAQDQHRIYTGIDAFDAEMRGIGRGHLCVIQGYSHSGKTQLLLKVLRENKHRNVALFIPDEPASLVLSKIAAVETGVPSRELEARIAANEIEAIDLLRAVANEEFPRLAVFDQPLTPEAMRGGYEEAAHVLGSVDLVVVDYVDLVQAGDATLSKFEFLKSFCSRSNVPMIAIHQTSRSAGRDGQKMKIDSGNFGGETFATFVIGVRRKKSALEAEREELLPRVAKGSEQAEDRLDEVEHDLKIHQFTMTINLVKNKRPGGSLVDDIDLEIDQHNGRLYPFDTFPQQYRDLLDRERELARVRRPFTQQGETF